MQQPLEFCFKTPDFALNAESLWLLYIGRLVSKTDNVMYFMHFVTFSHESNTNRKFVGDCEIYFLTCAKCRCKRFPLWHAAHGFSSVIPLLEFLLKEEFLWMLSKTYRSICDENIYSSFSVIQKIANVVIFCIAYTLKSKMNLVEKLPSVGIELVHMSCIALSCLSHWANLTCVNWGIFNSATCCTDWLLDLDDLTNINRVRLF